MNMLSRRLVATFLNSTPQSGSRRWRHTSVTPIQAFFARYPEFSYDSSKETVAQFHDMARQLKWEKATKRKAFGDIQGAMAQQFDEIYGKNADNLHDAQKLCKVVGQWRVPKNIDKCKAVLRRVYVNIWDVVDYPKTKIPPPIHPTEAALSEYTCKDERFYPRKDAEGFRKLLLRNIIRPSRRRGKSSTKPKEKTGSGGGSK